MTTIQTGHAVVPGWVIARVQDPTALRAYLQLAWKYADGARVAFPEEATLAEEIECSERTLQRAISKLRNADALVVTRSRQPDGYYGRNHYRLPLDDPRDPLTGTTNMTAGPDQARCASVAGHHHPPNMTGPGPDTDGGSKNQPDLLLQPEDLTPYSSASRPTTPDDPPGEELSEPDPADATAPARSRRGDPGRHVGDQHRLDVEHLCELLRDLIIQNESKPPTINKSWRNAARLMLDRDGRAFDEAERLIHWCQAHWFWHTNILSMPTFRKQYDKLRLQAKSENNGYHDNRSPKPSATEHTFARIDAAADKIRQSSQNSFGAIG